MSASNDGPGPRPLSHRVIEAVADEKGVEPTALEPLYHSIDPDCLNRLFSDEDPSTAQSVRQLTFTFVGHRIDVSHDGSVDVVPIDDGTAESSAVDSAALPSEESDGSD